MKNTINCLNVFWNKEGRIVFTNIGYRRTSSKSDEEKVNQAIEKINKIVNKLVNSIPVLFCMLFIFF